jgi:predicted small lipoprotein YifL
MTANRRQWSSMPQAPAVHVRWAALAALGLAATLAGCGVRGNLEAPPDAKAAGTATTGDAASAAGSSTKQQPHRPFILDGLIR